MKLFKLLIISMVLVGCATGNREENVYQSEYDWVLVWSDEFESDQIDDSKWNFINGAGGYGNNELQNYTGRDTNARIENGKLIIEAHEEELDGAPYTSAKMTTQNKGDWTYGRFEIRAKLPKGQGIWPAFWMMPTDYSVYDGWPSCGEIDIMELLGHEPERTYGTLHYGNPHKYTGDSYTLKKGDFSKDFHTFAIEWLPGEIRWFVDGELFQVQNEWFSNPELIESNLEYPAPFDRDFYLQLNLAVGGNWPGYPDETTVFPQQMEIEWIRVYESADGYSRFKRPAGSVEETVAGREPQKDGNYVLNESFDNGMEHWTFQNHEGGSGSASIENGEIHISIKDGGGQSWGNQLFQTDMNVKAGASYVLKFKARAEEPRNFMLKIGGLGDRGWKAYSGEQNIELDQEMREFTFEFTMDDRTDVKARYEFNMGLSDIDIWLDDISMVMLGEDDYVEPPRKALKNGNLIYNGNFDTGTGRTAYWNLELSNGTDVMIAVEPEIYKRQLSVTTLWGDEDIESIKLVQKGIDFEEGSKYQLSFDAKATSERTISAVITDSTGRKISEIVEFTLGSDSKTYDEVIYIPSAIKKGSVQFLFGGESEAQVVMDKIMLIKN